MKLRALLLCTLMVVVPLLAMFSHWIPPEVRATARRHVWESAGNWLGTPVEAGLAAPKAAPPPAVPSTPTPSGTSSHLPPEGRPVAAGAPLPAPPATTTGLRPIVPSTAQANAVVEPALVAQLADRSRQARDQQVVESRLKALGAVAFECQQVPGGGGLHVSSCRVPVDATGQLQRVFQATGNDPGSATEALVDQVQAWRLRAEQQPPATGPVDGASGGDRAR